MTTEDREALLRAREGHEEAARALIALHGGSMMRTARASLGRAAPGEAEDVVQEAWVAALATEALPTGDVGAWLRAIAVRKALDARRTRARRPEAPLDPAREPGTGGEGPRVTVLAVREALDQLSPADRATLVLADLEGRSMAEVAQTLGSTEVAVRLRASRARRKLRRLLQGVVLEGEPA
ncbi:MAG TPA: RNA polymerase sigma factor [Candidatus Polarisedimenticolaceae bacterium]|nr:RNA polymerase sigma factor [Candidatus Polarisedimenticolaceae bacterium]